MERKGIKEKSGQLSFGLRTSVGMMKTYYVLQKKIKMTNGVLKGLGRNF